LRILKMEMDLEGGEAKGEKIGKQGACFGRLASEVQASRQDDVAGVILFCLIDTPT